jgi:imidazoleglycerol phosphate synthase glutamine amidotransferase subunit HisH
MTNQEKTTEDIIANPEFREQLKAIVLERANAMPGTLRIAVGSEEFKKTDLIKHIKDEDEIGKQMMAMELGFLQALTSGAIYANE